MSEITNNFNQQAREAEKAVLGGLMLETERFDSVILKISDKDFHGKDHSMVLTFRSTPWSAARRHHRAASFWFGGTPRP